MTTSPVGGSRIARNAVWNVVGQGIPLLVGVAAIPITAHALGPGRFGLLGLLWALLGYFGVLDLGLGRATTKFVAEYLSRGDQMGLRRVATVAVTTQLVLGVVGGVLLFVGTPLLVDRVLHVPDALAAESRLAFRLLALSVPLVVASLSLRAILEAAQRFDLVNLIRTPSSILVFVVPAVVAWRGGGLALIVALLAVLRVAGGVAFALAIGRALPGFRWDLGGGWGELRALMGYGGWVAVSNAINPLLAYLERFILGSLAGVAAVAYYAAPYEAITRLLFVPSSLASALFPALSDAATGEAARLRRERLFQRSLRLLLLAVGPPSLFLIGCAGPITTAWLGPEYAARSAPALAILAAGVLMNGLAQLPSAYLLGRGRPDLPAKFHIAELALYAVGAWLLVHAFGVTGAAIAWTGRVTLDALLLGAAVWRAEGFEPSRWYGTGAGRALGGAGVLAAVTLVAALSLSPLPRVAVTGAAVLGFLTFAWRHVLGDDERASVRAVLT